MRIPDENTISTAESKTFVYHYKSDDNNFHYDAITNINGFYGKGYFALTTTNVLNLKININVHTIAMSAN